MSIKDGSVVTLDYKVYVNNQLIDQTEPNEPLIYVQGSGQVIPGLEKGVEGLDKGAKKELVIQPEDAYGDYVEDKVLHVPKEDLPPDIEPQIGMQLQAMSQDGNTYIGVVKNVKPDYVDIDFNHPMAGKTLKIDVEVIDVQD